MDLREEDKLYLPSAMEIPIIEVPTQGKARLVCKGSTNTYTY
jgi:hypothetical protein